MVSGVVSVNLADAIEDVRSLSRQLHGALDWLRDTAPDSADKERQYRKAKALAWVNRTEGTAAERAALVDADTADLRYERDLTEKLERAALEKVRAVRQEISAYQSLMAANRAEAEFARTGPQDGP
jgi:predicted  nucleic acid-binding Zn-ribbon protein